MKFLVSYDLNRPGQDYPDLWKALEQLKAVRVLDSAWYVAGNYTAANLAAHLRYLIDANDGLFVVGFNDWKAFNLLSDLN